jgi:hypothetical protein
MNPAFFATDLHDDRQRTSELPIVTNELPNEPWGLRTDRHEDRERIRELPIITEKQCHAPLALRLNLHDDRQRGVALPIILRVGRLLRRAVTILAPKLLADPSVDRDDA